MYGVHKAVVVRVKIVFKRYIPAEPFPDCLSLGAERGNYSDASAVSVIRDEAPQDGYYRCRFTRVLCAASTILYRFTAHVYPFYSGSYAAGNVQLFIICRYTQFPVIEFLVGESDNVIMASVMVAQMKYLVGARHAA